MNFEDHLTLAEIEKIKESINNGFADRITNTAKLVSLNYCGAELDPYNDDPSGDAYVQAGLNVKRPHIIKNSRIEYAGMIEIHEGGFLKNTADKPDVYGVTLNTDGTSSLRFEGQSHDVLPSEIVGFYKNSVLLAVENALNGKQIEQTRSLPKVGNDFFPLEKAVKPEVEGSLKSHGYVIGDGIRGARADSVCQNSLMVKMTVCKPPLPWQYSLVNPLKGRMLFENYMEGFEIPVSGGEKVLNDLQIELLGMENAVLEGIVWRNCKLEEKRIHLLNEARSPR